MLNQLDKWGVFTTGSDRPAVISNEIQCTTHWFKWSATQMAKEMNRISHFRVIYYVRSLKGDSYHHILSL